ncbi:MAG: hypothetical protein SAJ37_06735 [Oscillatoria sp. PMC 1068.18]|nr:hypothetical protein [Oscillatoria sp. PMC 1076.18]MEC4988429.1 hypothetical protein [Oscillatoria sp. PMC 1068.18]
MLLKKVIIHSSPLIVLFKSQQADLLPQLFEEFFVPQGVWDEITNSNKDDLASQHLPNVDWTRKVEVSSVEPEIGAED